MKTEFYEGFKTRLDENGNREYWLADEYRWVDFRTMHFVLSPICHARECICFEGLDESEEPSVFGGAIRKPVPPAPPTPEPEDLPF